MEGRVAADSFLDLESQFGLSVTTLLKCSETGLARLPSPKVLLDHRSSGFFHVLGTTFDTSDLADHIVSETGVYSFTFVQILAVFTSSCETVGVFQFKNNFLASAGEYCRSIWQTQVCLRDCFVT